MHADADCGEYRPAGHGRQVSEPRENVPAGHTEQLDADAYDHEPPGQWVQALAPDEE